MTRVLSRIVFASALALALTPTARAQDCDRLVEAYSQHVDRRDRAPVNVALPATSGDWFLIVSRSGNSQARVTLNGRRVVNANDLVGRDSVVIPVAVQSSNRLEVRTNRSGVDVALVGVVPQADLPVGVGRPVAELLLADEVFPGSLRASTQRLSVSAPGSEGLFLIRADNGPGRVLLGSVGWNGDTVFGPAALNVGRATTGDAPVAVSTTNDLAVRAFGFPGSQVRVTVRGFLIDEVAPTLAWDAPAAGSTPGPGDAVQVSFADALSGIDAGSLRIRLNGVDVTAAFNASATRASATLADLPAGALQSGANTLEATVADRACNEAQASVSFSQGSGGPSVPSLSHPGTLTVAASGAATPVHFTVRATDANDPTPSVVCNPPSGTAFPVGVTQVTCTATNAQGASSVATFQVVVVDAAAPLLGQANASFLGVASQPAGADPRAVALADLDGDGDLDAALANAQDDSLTVFLNDGAGGWTATTLSAGSQPGALAAGDLTGDGRPDLVCANVGGAGVTVFVNDGAGGFLPGVDAAAGGALDVALGDVTGDGALDAVVATGSGVSVLAGDGAGGLGSAQAIVAPGAQALALVDLDRDGRLDAVALGSGGLTALLNAGGALAVGSTSAAGTDPRALACADFDGDGWLDVAVADAAGAAQLLLGRGDGSFAPAAATALGGQPSGVCAADLDADGDADLVFADAGGNALRVALNGGQGGFSLSSVPAGATTAAVAAGDLDGDGRPDLVGAGADALRVVRGDHGVSAPTAEATSAAGGAVTYTAAARDAVDASPTVAQAPPSGGVFPLGTTPVTVSARDAAGNQSSLSFDVQVVDTTAPTLSALADVTVEQAGPAGSVVSYAVPSASDAVDGTPSVVCSPPPGSTFAAGTTTVTCTATDAAGNTSQGSFTVTVRDTVAPTLSAPVNLAFEQVGPAGTVATYASPTATDAADAAPVVVCSPPSGSLFAPGITVVTCTATDAAGNSAQVTFQVLVQDTVAPTLSQPPSTTIEQTSPSGAVVTFAAPTASDVADPSPGVVCVPASGSTFAAGVTTVTCTATDAAGNTAQVTFNVTVRDTQTPSLSLSPADGSSVPYGAVSLSATYADAGSGVDTGSFIAFLDGVDVSASFGVAAGQATGSASVGVGTHTLEVRLSDGAGNQALRTSTFTVAPAPDANPPSLSFSNPTDGGCVGPATVVQLQFSDAESGVEPGGPQITLNGVDVSSQFTVNLASGTAVSAASGLSGLVEGANAIWATVQDNAGNSSQQVVNFTYDSSAPSITLSPVNGATIDPAQQALSAAFADAGCGIDPASVVVMLDGNDVTATFTVDAAQAAGSPALGDGLHTWSVTVRDLAGNQTQLSATFTATSPAVALELTVSGDPGNLEIATPHDLVLRARTASGTTASSFTGAVLLTTSDGLLPLDGLVVDFTSFDQGVVAVADLALFRTLGGVTVNALSLEPPPLDINGALVVNVVVLNPVVFPELPAATSATGELVVAGYSFPGAVVQLVIDGAVVATTTAAADGSYSFPTVTLAQGDHTLLTRATDPVSGQTLESAPQVVSGPGPALPRDEPQLTGGAQEPADGSADADAAAVYGPEHGQPAGSSTVLSTGEKRLERVDLTIRGRGRVNFELRRRYRSQLDYDGPLGHGWDFSYNEGLHPQPNGDVLRNDGLGRVVLWTSLGGGAFSPAAGSGQFSTLRQEGDGSYTLREPDGFKRRYDTQGRLVAHQDRHGNALTFTYDARGNLERATDPFGRQVDFEFATFADGRDRLVTVRDFNGREVTYAYSANAYDLSEVRAPVVVGTSIGDDFPVGRTERYSYREGTGDPRLDHNLLTVTLPAEVASGGSPAITLAYGEDSGDPATYDRVTSEVAGGINATGVPAGGTIGYAYVPVNQAAGPDPSLARLDVTVSERNGNQLQLQVNERGHRIVERRVTRGLRAGEPAFYETLRVYTADGQLTREIRPLGNEVRHAYGTGSRAAQRNRVLTRQVADATRGGSDLVVTRTFEPLYQQLASETDARGNDAGYVPPAGAQSAERYTRRWFFDYQEGSAPVAEATDWGIDLSGVARGLGDLNGDGLVTRAAGNAVREVAPTVNVAAGSQMSAVLGDTTQEVVWERRWDDRGNLIAEVDPEGSLTTYGYFPENDPDGDGSTVLGQSSTLERGHLRVRTIDAASTPRRTASRAPAVLETQYGYDALGRQTLERNPRGVETRWEVNAYGEVVVETRGAETAQAVARGQLPTGELPFRYETRSFHDANGRVVRIEVEDDMAVSTTAGVGGWIEQTFSYDILGRRLTATQEVDASTTLTTSWAYDAHGLQISVQHPRGNVDTISYDERHLPFRMTEGAGSLEAGTYQLDYDANGNRLRLIDAEDHDGDLLGEETVYAYDGHDRLVSTTTPLGTQTQLLLDPVGNVVREQVFGHPGNQPGAPSQLLGQRDYTHDELNRVCRVGQPLFVVPGETPVRAIQLRDYDQDGVVVELFEHDALGRQRFQLEDDDEVTETRYDGAGRVAEEIDFLGNTVETFCDANGNPVRVQVTEIPGALIGAVQPAPRTTSTYSVYDQLDRLVRVSDPLGQTTRYGYDSRGNRTFCSDAQGPLQGGSDPLGVFPGVINDHGNTRSFVYDGADRKLAEITDLRVSGLGGGPLDQSNPSNLDGQITVAFGYDANGNLASITDDNGRATTFAFDARDRRVSRTLADGSAHSFGYDRDSNLTTTTDPNGSVSTHAYDVDNRRVRTDVARGAGVLGTTQQTFGYDGRGQLTAFTDNDSSPPLRATRVYDSLGRMVEEVQGGLQLPVTHGYSGDGDVLETVYPWGRVAFWAYDDLDRVRAVTMQENGVPTPIVNGIIYAGRDERELERNLANYTQVRHHDGLGNIDGWDDAGRETGFQLVSTLYYNAIFDRDYTYNRAGYRTSEKRWDDQEQRDTYVYDSAYRVVRTDLDREGIGLISRRDQRTMDYEYDGAGNRTRVTRNTLSLAPETTTYTADEVNAYTQVGAATRAHDANGNLIDDGTRSYQYDFQNRLVRVVNNASGAELAVYAYDALGRRVRRTFKDINGIVVDDLEYFYDHRSRVIEQYDHAAGERQLSVTYGPKGSHEAVYQEVTATSFNGPRQAWYVRNPRNDLLGVTDVWGTLALSFIYDDFGAAFITFGSSTFPPYLFQGRRFDAETGHYNWQPRYYDPLSGRFTSRDPGVYDSGNAGNQYTYAGNAPTATVEPTGRSADLQPAPGGPLDAVGGLLGR